MAVVALCLFRQEVLYSIEKEQNTIELTEKTDIETVDAFLCTVESERSRPGPSFWHC